MYGKAVSWVIFLLLSLIWGSSFILMKQGLKGLSAFEVASLRMVSAGLVLLPVALRYFKKIPKNKLPLVFLSGVLGSLMPAYLFCIAEIKIDSSLAGVLNSLTPIFVVIVGALFFKQKAENLKIIGILISLAGSALLFFTPNGHIGLEQVGYGMLVVIATMCYALNAYLVASQLKKIPSLHIAAVALVVNAIPALIILISVEFFKHDFSAQQILYSTLAACVLGVFGTALASIMFYMLIKRSGPVFSSLITYAIPVIAILWGVYFGEEIGIYQVFGLLVLLAGVYLVIKRKKTIPVAASTLAVNKAADPENN